MWRALWFSLSLLACTTPTVDKRWGGRKYTDAKPTTNWLFGAWEVVSVDGVELESLPEESIPFQVAMIDSEGALWLDTFSTTYTVLSNKQNKITLSYESIGYYSTLTVAFVDIDNAEIIESRQESLQQEPQTCRLVVRRLK
jgi:hypothetical protein